MIAISLMQAGKYDEKTPNDDINNKNCIRGRVNTQNIMVYFYIALVKSGARYLETN